MTSPAGFVGRLDAQRVAWLVVIAALVAFLPSIADGFVFDDAQLIVRNPFAHHFHFVGRCFTTDLWDVPERPVAAGSSKFYRPLVCASYIANFQLGGGAAWTFHLVNVLLHAAASALAARIALRWTGSPVAALVAALVFAVHPSRTENVEWISGRTDVLMALFLFAAHELAVSAARRGSAARAALSGTAFVAALLSKEFAVAWPLLLGVECVLARERPDDSPREYRWLWFALGGSLVASAVYLGLRAEFFPIRPPEVDRMALPLGLHVAYVFLSLGYYAERIALPWPQTFHFRPVAIIGGSPVLFTPSIIFGVVVAVVVAVWTIRAKRRDPTLAALLAMTVVLFLPIINVSYTGFPGTTADRFLYLPLFPLAVAVCRQTRDALTRYAEQSRLAPLVVGAGTLLPTAIDWVRSLDYASNETVWRHELEVNPNNPMALGGLAEVLSSDEDPRPAVALLDRASSPNAAQFGLLASPTRVYIALLELEARRVPDGDEATLVALLGTVASVSEGRMPRAALRLPDLDLAPPVSDPNFVVLAENANAHLLVLGAVLASRLGNDGLARAMTKRLGDDAPIDGAARYNLALALARGADYDGAQRELAIGLSLDPGAEFKAAADELGNRLARLQALAAGPGSAPTTAGVLVRARIFFDLGAYLRAARLLRPLYLADPTNVDVSHAYTEALSWARLDDDVAAVIAGSVGASAAQGAIDERKKALSPHTASLPKAPANPRYWTIAP
jgi:tetratricopeptide (TPR) repeat protein